MSGKSTVAVSRDILDDFRRAVAEKHGSTYGYTGEEAEKALAYWTEEEL